MSIDISSIPLRFSNIVANPGDVLLVEVALGNMPTARAKAYMEEVQALLKPIFEGVQLIICPTDTLAFTTSTTSCECSNCECNK